MGWCQNTLVLEPRGVWAAFTMKKCFVQNLIIDSNLLGVINGFRNAEGVSSMINRMYKSALIAGAMASSLLWASTAGAVTANIALSSPTVGGGVITQVAGPALNDVALVNTVYGNFRVVGSGQGSPPNPNPLDLNSSSNTALITQGAFGDISIYVTIRDITTPIGNPLSLFSSFTSNTLPAGWTVTETSYISSTNQLWTGTQLSSNVFNNIGTFTETKDGNTGAGPFSVTARYDIHATTAETALSTIDISVAQVPLPGALPLFIGGLAGLWALGRRRGKKVAQAVAA